MPLMTAQTSSIGFRQAEGLRIQVDLAGLNLGEVEHVVDELEQVPGAVDDTSSQILFLLRIQRTGLFIDQEFREADNAIERRAQLMRHVGEKLAFHLVGFLERLLEALAFRDVANGAHARVPSSVSSGLRLISTGNSVPSFRSP